MAVINPRLEQARRTAQQGGVTTYRQAMGGSNVVPLRPRGAPIGPPPANLTTPGRTGQSLAVQQAAAAFRDADRRRQAETIARGGEADADGWKGLVQDVFGNKVVQTVLKPLEVLDIPRRVVISGIQEGIDAFGDGDASWNDFMNQAKDPTFGFGTVVGNATGVKWVDRAIGLAGDILLDPMTYLSFGGSRAAKALGESGKLGRTALAERMVSMGFDANRAVEVAKIGKAALNGDELMKLGLDRAGVYFMGKRIAGTGRVAEAMEGSMSRARVRMGETILGRKADELFSPQDMAAARRAIAEGRVPKGRAAEYLHLQVSRNTERAAQEAAGREGELAVKTLMSEIAREDVESTRNTLHRVLESKDAAGVVSDAEKRVGEKVRDFLKSLWGSVDEDYKKIDSSAGFNQIDDYFPHMRTNEAYRYMGDNSNAHVEKLRSVIDDPMETQSVFKHRMKEGDEFFGKKLEADDLTIERLNEIAREGGFRGDFFETDWTRVLDKYMGQWAGQKGTAARWAYLKDKGVVESILSRQVADKKLVAQARKEIAKTKEVVDNAHAKVAETVKGFTDEASDAIEKMLLSAEGDVVSKMKAIEVGRGAAGAAVAAARVQRNAAKEALTAAGEALGEAKRAYARVLGADAPDLVKAMESAYDDTINRINRLATNVIDDDAAEGWVRGELATVNAELKLLDQQKEIAHQFGNLIQDHLDDIISGNTKGDLAKVIKAGFTDRKVPGGMEAVVKGNTEKGIRGMVAPTKQGERSSLWERVTKRAGIRPNDVAEMKKADVGKIVASAARGDAGIDELRIASLNTLARDIGIHGGIEDLPPTVRAHAERLIESLEKADEAARYFREVARDAATQRTIKRLDHTYNNLNRTIDEVYDSTQRYVAANRLLARVGALHPVGEVPIEQLDELLSGPYSVLRPMFEPWLNDTTDEIKSLMNASETIGAEDLAGLTVTDSSKGVGMAAPELASAEPLTFEEFTAILGQTRDETAKMRWNVRVEGATYEMDRSAGGISMKDLIDEGLDDFTDPARAGESDLLMDFIGRHTADLDAEVKVTRAEIKKLAPTYFDPNGQRTAGAAGDARKRLANDLTEYWMASEINQRMDALTQAMAPLGLVPTQDMYRKVVQQLGQERLTNVYSEYESASRGLSTLMGLRREVIGGRRKGGRWVGAEVHEGEAQDFIRTRLEELFEKDPSLKRVLARVGGDSQTPEILKQYVEMGGRTNRSGEARRLRMMGADADSRAAQAARRKQWMQEVGAPWYREVMGTRGAVRWDEMKLALDSFATASARRAWDDPSASLRDIERWLDDTIAALTPEARRMEREVGWLRQMTDPFIDPARVLVDPTGRQNLPSMYAAKMESIARDLEGSVDDVARRQAEQATAGAAAVEAQLPTYEAQANLDTLKGVANRDDALERARRAHERLVEFQNEPTYLAAVERKQMHDLMMVLADYEMGGPGKLMHAPSVTTQVKQAFETKGQVVEELKTYTTQQGGREVTKQTWVPITGVDNISETGRYRVLSMGGAPTEIKAGTPQRILFNGQALDFTPGEWRSLFPDEKLTRHEIAVRRNAANANLERAQFRAPRVVDEAERRELAQFIRAQRRELAELEIAEAAIEPGVQGAALEKMFALTQGVKSGRMTVDSIAKGMVGQTSDAVRGEARKTALEAIWKDSDDWGRLATADKLRSHVDNILYERTMRDSEATLSRAARARAAFEKASAKVEDAKLGLDEAQSKSKQALADALDAAEGRATALDPSTAQTFGQFVERAFGSEDPTEMVAAARGVASDLRTLEPTAGPMAAQTPEAIARTGELTARKTVLEEMLGRPDNAITDVGGRANARFELNVLESQAAQQRHALDVQRAAWARQRDAGVKLTGDAVKDREAKLLAAQAQSVEAARVFDQAKMNRLQWDTWSQEQMPTLGRNLRMIQDALASTKFPAGDLAEMRMWIDSANDTLAVLRQLGHDTDPITQAIERGVADAHNAMAELYKANRALNDKLMEFPIGGVAADGTPWGVKIKTDMAKGWMSLEKMGLGNVKARVELVDMMKNMSRLQSSAVAKEMNRFLGKYTKFFKAYATLSPGFHVRNAMSNTFMLFAAGGDLRSMSHGMSLYGKWADAVKAGAEEAFIASLGKDEAAFRVALKATDAAGGGRVGEMFANWFPKRHGVSDNFLTRGSQALGGKVENSGRFMLAWDTIKKAERQMGKNGGEFVAEDFFHTATARVKKYLFDYNDVGVADESIRSIVPFWMWMSRNLPLQIVNQWQNPRAYQIYNTFMRNVGQDDDEMVPSWLEEMGAVNIGGDMYLAPDVGFTRVSTQLQEFGDPARLMSYVNPAIRLPVELLGGRRLYNEVPFNENPQQVTGGPFQGLLEPLLRLAGQAHTVGPNGVRDANGTMTMAPGETATTDKVNFALESLLPFLARAERLAPAMDQNQQRQGASWMSFLGLPLREVTPSMRDAEANRRLRALEEMRGNAEAFGYTA